ncbi:MAG TPA: hypothetical protein VIM52_07510, partial [Stellaceae bacterium]
MHGIGRANEDGVRGGRRPAREIRGPEIRRIDFGPGDLDDTVDATGAAGGRVPALASGQCLARREVGHLGCGQTRQAKRNTAR